MKRIAFFVALLMLTLVSFAQHPQTFYTLDSTKYDVDWWYTDWYADSTHCLASPFHDSKVFHRGDEILITTCGVILGEDLQRHFTDKAELPVYGLAVAGCFALCYYGRDENNHRIDDFVSEDYLKIFETAADGTFYCLDSVRWHFSDSHDYLNVHVRGNPQDDSVMPIDTFCVMNRRCQENLPMYPFMECIQPIPFFEYYFDNPVVVSDSFYVGYTCGNNLVLDPNNIWAGVYASQMVPKARTLDSYSFYGVNGEVCPVMHPVLRKRICYDVAGVENLYPTDHWTYESRDDYLLVFPILTPPVPPDTDSFDCPRVENFRLSAKGDDYAAFAWDTVDSQQQFRISVGPWDADPNSNPTYRCSQNPLYITSGLDTGRYYAAYIRPQCHHSCVVHDTTFWADWGDPLYFFLGNREPEQGPFSGIHPATDYPTFSLTPNPAHHQVKVSLSDPLDGKDARLILTDAAGRELLRLPASGKKEITIPLDNYAAGLYYVTLSSSQGSSTQKLVVE